MSINTDLAKISHNLGAINDGTQIDVILTDLTKAFDRVAHRFIRQIIYFRKAW